MPSPLPELLTLLECLRAGDVVCGAGCQLPFGLFPGEEVGSTAVLAMQEMIKRKTQKGLFKA